MIHGKFAGIKMGIFFKKENVFFNIVLVNTASILKFFQHISLNMLSGRVNSIFNKNVVT